MGLHKVPDLAVNLRNLILEGINDLICHSFHVSSLLGIIDDSISIGAIYRALGSVEGWICCLDSIVQIESVHEDWDIIGQSV